MDAPDWVAIEVVYVGAEREFLKALRVPPGTSLRGAIERSRVLQECPEIDLGRLSVGIFGRVCALEATVAAGDRVEIYRPLLRDPKDARRARARG